jgi:hypothetical protein
MVYDEFREEVILAGGCSQWNDKYDETWLFNITTRNWTTINDLNLPGNLHCHQMVYHSRLQEIVSFGGLTYGKYGYFFNLRGETWAFHHRSYQESGEYLAPAVDTGGLAHFGNISWNATIPSDTAIRFQLRSGITNESLQSKDFIGPDGTKRTYYTGNAQRINCTAHNGDRWFQYKAYLSTSAPSFAPILHNVQINYNLIHEVKLTSPSGNENWTNIQNITWTANDLDNDSIAFDLYIENDRGSSLLVQGLADATRKWEWDTLSTPPGQYRIRLYARDNNLSIPLEVIATSPNFTIYHNHPPRASLIYPPDEQILNITETTLEWVGEDDERDPLKYYLLFANRSFSPGDDIPALTHTNATSHNVTGLADEATYYWTVVPSDGKANGSIPPVRSFLIDLPYINRAPSATLSSPENAATFNSTTVQLSWNGSDQEGDNITYRLFLASYALNESSLPAPLSTTNATSYMAGGLMNGTTYYWAVIPNDGALDGPLTAIRSFSIDISKGNDLPVIGAVTPPNAYVNEQYLLNITASDPENGSLTFNLTDPPTGMTIDTVSGRIQWAPDRIGNFTVTVKVTDIKGGFATLTFTVKVVERPLPVKPTVSISSANNSKISKKAQFSGTTTPGTFGVSRVEIFLDDISAGDANGTASWSFEVDTAKLTNGKHTFRARAYDSSGNYSENSIDFTVNNPTAIAKTEFPWWILGLVVIISAVGIGALAYSTRKKAPVEHAHEEDSVKEPSAPAEEKAPLAEPTAENEPPVVAISTETPPKPVQTATAPVAPAKAVKAPLTPRPPTPASPVAAVAFPEGFAVEDIFLIYRDGRLIQHATRRLKADMDVDVVTSMLTAVQEFIKESFGKAEGQELGSMEFGDCKILLQKGTYIVLAAVISGPEASGFRDELKAAVKNIEGEFATVLPNWNGIVSTLAGSKRFLTQLGAYRSAEAPPAKAKDEVSLKSELEFYQGFVRLKVAVKNSMPTMIAKATFKLIYNEGVFRLDHVEPELERTKDEVALGIVEPSEKKTVAFYLDPQICTESHIEGVLTYKDAKGGLETLKMPRKMASVVCPILFTEENINTAMLKRMAVDDLPQKDTKVFATPPTTPPDKAFEIAKAAVQHHDVRLVREFVEKDPYIGEAWYYGKAKGREDKIVIRARVLSSKNLLEFFVASSSTLMLTGMLAELKTDLNKELDSQKVRAPMRQVTRPEEVDALAAVRTLLEKASERETGAGETDTKN